MNIKTKNAKIANEGKTSHKIEILGGIAKSLVAYDGACTAKMETFEAAKALVVALKDSMPTGSDRKPAVEAAAKVINALLIKAGMAQQRISELLIEFNLRQRERGKNDDKGFDPKWLEAMMQLSDKLTKGDPALSCKLASRHYGAVRKAYPTKEA